MLELIGDVLSRQWHDLLDRPSGPMSFRFLLQPAMAILFAIRDGIKDARTGRSPYFWTVLHVPAKRRSRLREGIHATGRIIFLGLVMDVIYQFIVLRKFYPVESIIVALTLAFVPYFLVRGPVDRIARWWQKRHPSGSHLKH